MSSAAIEIRPTRNQEELAAALFLRRKVFVQEQGIFHLSDRDQNDQKAIHLVALVGEKVIGTVRIFPERGRTWRGSRLAVEGRYRNGVGARLVKEAEREVRGRGGKRLTALVQNQNVTFFRRLGWRRTSDPFVYRDKLHCRMEKVFSNPGKNGSGDSDG